MIDKQSEKAQKILNQKAQVIHDTRYSSVPEGNEYLSSTLQRVHGMAQWAMDAMEGVWAPPRPNDEVYTTYNASFSTQRLRSR